jgi:hypothetical protein
MAGDAAWLGAVAANKLGLITAPFVPSVDLLLSDITLATLPALAPLAGVAGVQNESVDPLSGEIIVEVKPPAGGFRWETAAGFAGGVTVYGYALIDGADTKLIGTQQETPPIALTDANQSITAPAIEFRIDPTQIT